MGQIDINKLIKEVKKDMDSVHVPYNDEIPIFINSKYSRALGKCYYGNINGKKKSIKIGISEEIINHADINIIKNTICHELIHSADDCVYAGHTGKWKYYASIMNRYKNYKISRTTTLPNDMQRQYKYVVECQDCKTKSYFQRKSPLIKKIQLGQASIRCKRCGGTHFEVRENR